MALKRTAFNDVHRRLGAKLVEFAGFEMPVQYAGIIEEHRAVRSGVGVFDVSHMGEIEVWGRDALAFVQLITTNDASKLTEGVVQYSAMCYDDGGIVDDLLVYHMGDHFMLVVNAANVAQDYSWMQSHLTGDVKLKDRSDDIALLAIQGPRSVETLRKLTRVNLETIASYRFVREKLAGEHMVISRTGYTGEAGFELYFPSDPALAQRVWDAVMRAGEEFGIVPAGLGARDTLRLEMGYCLYGHDIDRTTHPLEAGLGWITKLEKGEFLGRPAIVNAKVEGLKRKLVGFAVGEKAFPRQGYPIRVGDRQVGSVTSGTFSPSLDKGIGMGYVDVASAKPGTAVSILIRNREVPARVESVPFIKKQRHAR